MKLIKSIVISIFVCIAIGFPQVFSQNIEFKIVKEVGDKYLQEVMVGNHTRCYEMMAPPFTKTLSEEDFKTAFIQLENMFGKVSHFEYQEWEQGVRLYPANSTHLEYPLIKLIYLAEVSGKELKAHVSVILIDEKLWISDYLLFSDETNFEMNLVPDTEVSP